ncbi:MAG: PAS domain-containing protein [Deltaproteobacteria bacterium]|nr:MAG: PAS domain-containing protein [Deltaproteobacteria bacterium]
MQHVEGKAGLARSGDPGHGRHRPDGHTDADSLEIVLSGPLNEDESTVHGGGGKVAGVGGPVPHFLPRPRWSPASTKCLGNRPRAPVRPLPRLRGERQGEQGKKRVSTFPTVVLGSLGRDSTLDDNVRSTLAADVIVANAPDPVFVCDLRGKILEANAAVSQLLGLRRDEVLEQSVSRFLSPPETQEFVAAVREVVDRGVTRNLRLHPGSASGEVIPTTLNASALRDGAGRAIGVIGILRDMRELDKARAYAESLIKNAPDPVFVSDLRGKILQANDAVFELLGFRPDEVIEQSLSRIISAEETREFIAALREVVERGVTRNVRLNPRSAAGEVIPTTLNASALRDPDGTVIGAIGILRDMRAYERVVRDLEQSRRELREADKAKDHFLAMVSHELRTPLTAMLGWARVLRVGFQDAVRAARGLEVIERNTKLLAQLIEDLLDVSRIVTGKLRIERRQVDPVAIVEAAIEAVQGVADAKDIELHASLDPDAGPLLADPDRLQQVVWNLLSNAIKFSPARARVGIRLECAGSLARITVSDEGAGIKPELLPHIFDRFRQGERSSGGLGLGLAIVRHIVELHGGAVRAQSAGERQGATFTVELPTLNETGTVAAAAPHPGEGSARTRLAPLQGARLLVVDDDTDTRELLSMILQEAGADVTTAGSANEGLAAFERQRPDVLVSDIGMPGSRRICPSRLSPASSPR